MKKLSHEEERELLAACISGDGKEKLVRQYRRLVFMVVQKTFALKRAPFSVEDIEDIRNEVFVHLFDKGCRRLKQYKEGAGRGLASWITLIANRIALNFLRKKGFDSLSWRNGRIPIEDELFRSRGEAESPHAKYEKEEQLHRIRDGMEALAPGDRLILKLHYIHGLPLPEVASYLDKSVGAVYTAKSRALDRLRKRVKRGEREHVAQGDLK